MHGADGVAWLRRLPTIIADCEQRWSLRIGAPFAPLSYNYAAPGVRTDGTAVVLKVGVPHPELMSEIESLRLYAGDGIVRLLQFDCNQGALLLERAMPGTSLAELGDDEAATSIAAQLMRQLWRPVPPEHIFPSVAKWAAGLQRLRAQFDGTTGPFPRALVEQAETLFTQLLSAKVAPVLLHGDLHHENILAAERDPWLAIDPKGLVGDPGYEVGAFLHNQLPDPVAGAKARAILQRRVDQFGEELGFERARVRDWGLALAVLSAWWTYEDHGYVGEEALACAEVLATVKV